MEIIPGVTISLSMIVGFMVKTSMLLLTLLGIIMVRQASLMDKVVNLPVGKSLKLSAWIYFFISLLVTVIVLLA